MDRLLAVAVPPLEMTPVMFSLPLDAPLLPMSRL
jgi:hypothetical protein